MFGKAASTAILLGSVVVPGTYSLAQTAQGKFGLRLVIEPDCRNPDDPLQTAERMAPEASDARDIARSYLMSLPDYRYLAARDLIAEHDLADTGNWLISARGIEDPILRVEKCSGQVTSLIA